MFIKSDISVSAQCTVDACAHTRGLWFFRGSSLKGGGSTVCTRSVPPHPNKETNLEKTGPLKDASWGVQGTKNGKKSDYSMIAATIVATRWLGNDTMQKVVRYGRMMIL